MKKDKRDITRKLLREHLILKNLNKAKMKKDKRVITSDGKISHIEAQELGYEEKD